MTTFAPDDLDRLILQRRPSPAPQLGGDDLDALIMQRRPSSPPPPQTDSGPNRVTIDSPDWQDSPSSESDPNRQLITPMRPVRVPGAISNGPRMEVDASGRAYDPAHVLPTDIEFQTRTRQDEARYAASMAQQPGVYGRFAANVAGGVDEAVRQAGAGWSGVAQRGLGSVLDEAVLGGAPAASPEDFTGIMSDSTREANAIRGEAAGATSRFVAGLASMPATFLDPKTIAAMLISHSPSAATSKALFNPMAMAAIEKKFGTATMHAVQQMTSNAITGGGFGGAHAAVTGGDVIEGATQGAAASIPFGVAGTLGVMAGERAGAARMRTAESNRQYREDTGRAFDPSTGRVAVDGRGPGGGEAPSVQHPVDAPVGEPRQYPADWVPPETPAEVVPPVVQVDNARGREAGDLTRGPDLPQSGVVDPVEVSGRVQEPPPSPKPTPGGEIAQAFATTKNAVTDSFVDSMWAKVQNGEPIQRMGTGTVEDALRELQKDRALYSRQDVADVVAQFSKPQGRASEKTTESGANADTTPAQSANVAGTEFANSAAGKQWQRMKERHPGTVLMYRIGDFYETFGDDAQILSKTTGVTLTKRYGTDMAGVPHHQLETYLKKLISAGKRVAVVEKVAEAPKGEAVERVVTPGNMVGGKQAPAEQHPERMVSKSGRQLPPFPDKASKYSNRDIRTVDGWLIEQAIKEAIADGNEHAENMFRSELPLQKQGLPQASRDSANEYIFGRQDTKLNRQLKPAGPKNMAGQVREAPKVKPPAPDLPQASIDKMDAAIKAKDMDWLINQGALDPKNRKWREQFTSRTGVKLPTTQKGTRAAVVDWIKKEAAATEKPAAPAPGPSTPEKPAPKADPKANRFRVLAHGLKKQADELSRDMTQNPTPKRMREYGQRRTESHVLYRAQKAFEAMADAREAGTLPPELESVSTKAEVVKLLSQEKKSNGGYYDAYYETGEYLDKSPKARALQDLIAPKSEQQKAAAAAKANEQGITDLENKVRFSDIPGFFPTPKALVERMIVEADIGKGMKVLEPSAGKGDIADAAKAAGASVTTAEISHPLREILKAKGHDVVAEDFLQHKGKYDRIVMNPPFERGQDIEHVQHAYEQLTPGGKLVAIMSEGSFTRSDKKATGFREWMDSVGGTSEQIPAGAFAEQGAFKKTGVSTRLVTIEKTAESSRSGTAAEEPAPPKATATALSQLDIKPPEIDRKHIDRLNLEREQAKATEDRIRHKLEDIAKDVVAREQVKITEAVKAVQKGPGWIKKKAEVRRSTEHALHRADPAWQKQADFYNEAVKKRYAIDDQIAKAETAAKEAEGKAAEDTESTYRKALSDASIEDLQIEALDRDAYADLSELTAPETKSSPPSGAMGSPMRSLPATPIKGTRIEVDAMPTKKPKQVSEMMLDLQKGIGQVRAGSTKGNLGLYYPGSSKTIVRFTGDLDTTAHEVAHRLDDLYGIVAEWATPKGYNKAGAKIPKKSPFDKELRAPIFQQTIQKHYSTVQKRAEGVAEFMRAWMLNPAEATKQAPGFTKFFEQKVPGYVRARIRAFGDDVRGWAGQDPLGKASSNIKFDFKGPGLIERVKQRFESEGVGGGFLTRLNAAVNDSLAPVWKGIELAKQLQGIDDMLPAADPKMRLRLFNGFDRKAMDVLAHGPIRFNGERAPGVGGVDWIIKPLKSDTKAALEADTKALYGYMTSQRVVERVQRIRDALQEARQLQRDIEQYRAVLAQDPLSSAGEDLRDAIFRQRQVMRGVGYSGSVDRMGEWAHTMSQRMSGAGGGVYSDISVAKEALAEAQKDPARLARIKEAAQRHRAWSDAVLQYMVDGGRVSAAAAKEIRDGNQFYVAMKRLHETVGSELRGGGPGSKRLASAKQTIQQFKGSTREVENPFVSLIKDTYDMMRETDRNAAMASITRLLDKNRGRDMYQGKPIDFDQIGSRAASGDMDAITIYRDGKAESWQFAAPIHKALQNWGISKTPDLISKAMMSLASLMRNTITLAPQFMIRQQIRDPLARAVVSRSGTQPWEQFYFLTPAGIHEYAKIKSEFDRAGGGLFGHQLVSKEHYYKRMRGALAEAAGDGNTILSVPGKIGNAYKAMAEGGETINRLAEYRRAYAKAKAAGLSDLDARMKAALEARDLQDFSVAGTLTRALNSYIPFTSAAVRGVARAVESAVENPARFAARWALYVASVELAHYAWNHSTGAADEERKLTAYRRDFFWNYRLGDWGWLSIPKPYELGVMGSGLSRLLDKARGVPDAFDGYAGSFWQASSPLSPGDLMGPLQPIVSVMSNYNFDRQKPIVPDWEVKIPPGRRLGERMHSSKVGQLLGKWLGVDARYIDTFIRTQLGGLGTLAIRATEPDNAMDAAENAGAAASGVLYKNPK